MKNNKINGSALLTVLIVMMVLSILGVTLLNVSLVDNKFAIHEEKRLKAYYIARAGAEATAAWVSDKSKTKETINALIIGNENNDDIWTPFEEGRFKIRFPGDGDVFRPRIESVGEYDEDSQSTVSLSLKKKYFFDSAITVLSNLDIKNGNVDIIGSIALVPGATITLPSGEIATYPLSEAQMEELAGIVTGSVTEVTRTFTIPTDPGLPSADWPSSNQITSTDGGYSYADVDIGSATINIILNGDMQIQFTSLKANNAAINVTGTGNLVIYIDELDFKGDLYTASTAKTTFIVYSSGSVDYKTSSTFQGFIYGPGADITVTANAGVIGFIIAKNLFFESGSGITYNSAYGNVYPEDIGFPSEGYDKDLWVK